VGHRSGDAKVEVSRKQEGWVAKTNTSRKSEEEGGFQKGEIGPNGGRRKKDLEDRNDERTGES